jgi:crotonobetainyl-CoA:carnitine CoA-transferase CaiB-like acyl-CoA transferase
MKDVPLKGIRVIDLSHSWAAPHCTRILADFGAEVIKVEYPRRLCLLRGARKEKKVYDSHPAWFQVNRNKLSITLDLKSGADRQILRELVKISDVLVHNSRTGVMDRLGFGYADLVNIKEDLVVLSMSAFGQTGPYASYAGYGAVFEALGGIQSLSAYEKNAKPARVKEIDTFNGVMGACAVMTALIYRQRTGKGQHIDLSQLEAATHATIGEHLLEYAMNGVQTSPQGNRHRFFAPQGCYRCNGEDRWIAITIRSDDEWRKFCEVLGHQEWFADPRFATREARQKNHDQLDRLIEAWTLSRNHCEAMHELQHGGLPAGAVLDVVELSNDLHLRERCYFLRSEKHPGRPFMGMPFRLKEGCGKVYWRGPDLGQHNKDVLCDMLGRSEEDVKPIREEEIGTAFDPR